MNVICLLRGHEWYNEFMRPLINPDETIVTGVCLRCGKQKAHISVKRNWNSAGIYTYDVTRNIKFPPSVLPPHLQANVAPPAPSITQKPEDEKSKETLKPV